MYDAGVLLAVEKTVEEKPKERDADGVSDLERGRYHS